MSKIFTKEIEFTIKIGDIMAQVKVQLQIVVSAAANPLTVDASAMPAVATVGVPYSGSLKVSGGVPPYSFSIDLGALPPGLTLDPNAGTVTGTPTAAGTDNFEVVVADSGP